VVRPARLLLFSTATTKESRMAEHESVPVRLTLNIECPECHAREAHVEMTLPYEIRSEWPDRAKPEVVFTVRHADGVNVAILCANETCGRVVRFGRVPLKADEETLLAVVSQYTNEGEPNGI
jgi:hypothetical protein